MQFQLLPFDKVFAPYINKIIYLNRPSNNRVVNQVLPTGMAYLNFIYSDSLSITYPEGEIKVPRGCYIHGQLMKAKVSQTLDISSGADYQDITVELKPIALQRLVSMDAFTLTDRFFLLEDILGKEVKELYERIGEQPVVEDKLRLILKFLEQKLLHKPRALNYTEATLQQIYHCGGNVNFKELAQHYHVSNRYLEKLFRKEIGLPPKFYARLIRFKSAVKLMMKEPGISQSELAYRCGYYDPSHMHRDFLDFSGFRPGDFTSLPTEFTKIIVNES